MDILDILDTAGGRRRRINNLAAGGRERPGAVSPGGHQHRPGQGYHSLGDSLGALDKQIFRCFVKHVDDIPVKLTRWNTIKKTKPIESELSWKLLTDIIHITHDTGCGSGM